MFASLKTSLIVGAAFAALSALPAMASGAYHPQSSEAGATFHPDHIGSRTRSQVNAELVAAMQSPAWSPLVSRGAPWPVAKGDPGKTRAQVNAELNSAMRDPNWVNVSRGAPWPGNGFTASQVTPK